MEDLDDDEDVEFQGEAVDNEDIQMYFEFSFVPDLKLGKMFYF